MSASVNVDGIVEAERSRQDLGDLTELAKSIETVGLLHPVVVTPDMVLVAGQRRLAAVRLLGWAEVDVHVVRNLDDAALMLAAERDENTCRKDFLPSEMVAMGMRLEALERPLAAERKGGRPRKDETEEKISPVSGGKTTEKVAKAVGVSRPTYEKARDVVRTANDRTQPAKVRQAAKAAMAEMDQTGKVDPAAKKVRHARDYAEAVDEFEFLAPDQSPGVPEEEVVEIAEALRATPEIERETRIEAAKTWHRVYGNPDADDDRHAQADRVRHGQAVIAALHTFVTTLERHGDAEHVAEALERGFNSQSLTNRAAIQAAAVTNEIARITTDQQLRSVR